jgi:hypothetical protein
MSVLTELQDWYASQCDGDWEHEYGIKISTLDNPGWWVSIRLGETNLEDIPFEEINTKAADGRWMMMRVRDQTWEAACDPSGLETALAAFIAWSRDPRVGARRPR